MPRPAELAFRIHLEIFIILGGEIGRMRIEDGTDAADGRVHQFLRGNVLDVILVDFGDHLVQADEIGIELLASGLDPVADECESRDQDGHGGVVEFALLHRCIPNGPGYVQPDIDLITPEGKLRPVAGMHGPSWRRNRF